MLKGEGFYALCVVWYCNSDLDSMWCTVLHSQTGQVDGMVIQCIW